ncbi:polysaccharide lyase family 1 protein [Amycolatopsis sp. NPDC051758]|uniref:polysaccharide lyase family 1 protein n=1 Tax=Amycolatopsis sp. NPDC051758 TaxID=3363935 RepID=UPI003792ABC2
MTRTARFSLRVSAAAALAAAAAVTAPAGVAHAAYESSPAGFGAGTTGGAGGETVTVTTASAFTSAVTGTTARTVRVSGKITLANKTLVKIGSNKTVLGVGSGSGFTGGGLAVDKSSNVILRNLVISKAVGTDAIQIQRGATKVWVDHNDLSSDLDHGKDYYDGLLDISHAADGITVSWNKFHDHYKVSLVGHSDSNAAEDTGKLHVTYSHNWFDNVNSRLPSLRFGTGHAYDNYFRSVTDSAVHSRMNAQFLAQNNVFESTKTCLETTGDSDVDGYLNESGNSFGGCANKITRTGSMTSAPYSFTLEPTSTVKATVTAGAGAGRI